MGVWTSGELSCNLSRDLTEEEFAAWKQAIKTEPPYGQCPDPEHFCRHYSPDDWYIQDDAATTYENDISLDQGSFTVWVSGKVYDLTHAVQWIVHCLPKGVTANGTGYFDSDGEDWAIVVDETGVHEAEVILQIGQIYDTKMHPLEKLIEWAQEAADAD